MNTQISHKRLPFLRVFPLILIACTYLQGGTLIVGDGQIDISVNQGDYCVIGGVEFINSGLSPVSNPDVFLSINKPGSAAGGLAKAFNTAASSIDSAWDTDLNKTKALPYASLEGSKVGNASHGFFYSFFLDTNEPNNVTADYVTISHLEIWASAEQDRVVTDYANPTVSQLGETLIYEMPEGSSVRTRPASGGGQTGDVLFYVPESYFERVNRDEWIYFYIELTENDGKSALGLAEDFTPTGEMIPTPPSLPITIPELSSLALLGLAFLSGTVLMRRRKKVYPPGGP